MNEQILSNVLCSICLETYQPPIRMLPCGHNFCESCLVDLQTTSQQEIRCPKCREAVQIGSEGFSILPRCHDIESLIEVLIKMELSEKQKSDPIPVLSGDAITQLYERATLLMNDENYQEALELLQIVTTGEKIPEKIFHFINKANCQIEIGLKEEAVVTATEIASLALSKTTIKANESDSIKKEIFQKLTVLCKKFIKFNLNDSVLSLVNCLFSLTKTFYEVQTQLEMFPSISALIGDLIIKMFKCNKEIKIKQFYCLFDEIFDNMQMISNVDLKFKCKQIVLLLENYGLCCNKGNDFLKSEIIHHKAISMMELVFGSEAKQNMSLGHCYNNLGVCIANLNRLEEAKMFYLKALKVYEEATDLIDENKRHELISISSKNLKFIENK